jgi:hypothetical protein
MSSRSQTSPIPSDMWILGMASFIFLSGLFVGYRFGSQSAPTPPESQQPTPTTAERWAA